MGGLGALLTFPKVAQLLKSSSTGHKFWEAWFQPPPPNPKCSATPLSENEFFGEMKYDGMTSCDKFHGFLDDLVMRLAVILSLHEKGTFFKV